MFHQGNMQNEKNERCIESALQLHLVPALVLVTSTLAEMTGFKWDMETSCVYIT